MEDIASKEIELTMPDWEPDALFNSATNLSDVYTTITTYQQLKTVAYLIKKN